MECKESDFMEALEGVYDLIDTLWNVKCSVNDLVNELSEDLIDTLWNVK